MCRRRCVHQARTGCVAPDRDRRSAAAAPRATDGDSASVSTMLRVPMRVCVVLLVTTLGLLARPALAQDPPPPIPWVVVDLHATVPRFPSDDAQLAQSRGMQVGELPGRGLGAQVGLHLYPLRTKVVTFGLGGELAVGRAKQTPDTAATGPGVTPL